MMDNWKVLGIQETQDIKQIKRAYALKLKTCHPEEKPMEFQMLRRAYEQIIEKVKKETAKLSNNDFLEAKQYNDFLDVKRYQDDEQYQNDNPKTLVANFMDKVRILYDDMSQRIELDKWIELLEDDMYWRLDAKLAIQSSLINFLIQNNNLPHYIWSYLDKDLSFLEQLGRQYREELYGARKEKLKRNLKYFEVLINIENQLSYDIFNRRQDIDYEQYLSLRKKAYFELLENDLDEAESMLNDAYKLFSEDEDLIKLISILLIKKYPINDAYNMYKRYIKNDCIQGITLKQFVMVGRCIRAYDEIKGYLDKIDIDIPNDIVTISMFNKIVSWWKSGTIYKIRSAHKQLIRYIQYRFQEDIPEKIINIGIKEAKEEERHEGYTEALKIYDWLIKHLYRDDEEIKRHFIKVYLSKQDIYEDQGNYRQVAKCYEALIKMGIEYADLWFYRARALNCIGQYEEALSCCQTGLEMDPEPEANMWNIIGWAYKGLKKYEKAIQCYDKALEEDPSDIWAWSNKCSVHIDKKDYEKALACAVEQTKLHQTHSMGWNNRGVALEYLKRYEEALECFMKAIDCESDNHISWANKGDILYRLKRFDEALECYETCININWEHDIAWLGKGKVYYQRKRFEEALMFCNKALTLDDENEDTWEYKGKILFMLGNIKESKLCFKKKKAVLAEKL